MVPDDAVGYNKEPTARGRTEMAAPAIGVFLPTMRERDVALPDISAAARHAEDLGFESVWAVDQLVAGTGVPFVDSTVALAAAAGATERIRLGYGVMILPLHSVVWAAKQVASLQQVSGGRVLLGVGVGGDRHARSWEAAGVPRSERGRRTDAALAVLPDLIAGKAVDVGDMERGGATVQLAPGVAVPPILVGGVADAALARTAAHGDGWFAMPVPPAQLVVFAERLAALAAARGRPAPAVTGSTMVAIAGDRAVPAPDELVRRVSDPDGMFGMPAEAVPDVVLTGGPASVAEHLAAQFAAGAERVVVTVAAGDWFRQAELLAEAAALVAAPDH
jgi:alkanesulfonate monooxygenase SsuD/methylene tetrahydromethanopterin reductase-like flavin-dependent oxidoreductase (luciferase family)